MFTRVWCQFGDCSLIGPCLQVACLQRSLSGGGLCQCGRTYDKVSFLFVLFFR